MMLHNSEFSILRTTPTFLRVSDLKNTLKILDLVIFANDTNFFFTHQNIIYLFKIVKQEG